MDGSVIDARDLRRAPLIADPRALCEALGLADGAQRQGGGLLVRCPAHADRTPSCSVRRGADGTVAVRCFGCDFSGDALGLIAAVAGLEIRRDFPAVVARAAELSGVVDGGRWVPPPRPTTPPEPPREYPPTGELAALWDACRPVTDDAEVAAWLRSRALDPADLEARDLARALSLGAQLPRWARGAGQRWTEGGYRVLVPLFDEKGTMRSLRARRVTPGDPKNLTPLGCKTGALVLADAPGRLLLSTGARPAWWAAGTTFRVLIVEGEPDFLTWAARFSEADEIAPSVLGIPGSGGWSEVIAGRIPDGTRVIVRTDADPSGDKYAAAIADMLAERCDVVRAGRTS